MKHVSSDHLDMDQADAAWDYLSGQVEAFIDTWDTEGTPPALPSYLPDGPLALRRMTLVELIKVDLEYRRTHDCPRTLQYYLEEFPELAAGGDIPCDLIYEEFHLRKKAGETVSKHDYLERFPQQRTQLQRLLGLESPYQTTMLCRGQKKKSDAPKAGEKLDDFDLYHEVGSGAFATVFLARQRSMQRLVALKISADESDEPQALAQLDHPNIVRVYDQRLLAEQRLRLLYMQFVPGGTLHEVLEEKRDGKQLTGGEDLLACTDAALRKRGDDPPPDSSTRRRVSGMSWPRTIAWLGSQLAEALHYAHARGVLHRDIKPANVLLSSDGRPLLADFNISYASEVEGATPETFFGGSVAYMSPEQLEAYHPGLPREPEQLDGRADVYSLALMLWELLAGRRPFEDRVLPEGWPATIERMLAERRKGVTRAAMDRLPLDCSPALRQALLRALAPMEADRYENAGQFAKALAQCLEDNLVGLMHPARDGWRAWVVKAPFPAFLTAVVVPNLCASILNISYNFKAIFEQEGIDSAFFWNTQLLVVNPVLYSIGMLTGFLLSLPVLHALRRMRHGHQLEDDSARRAASRGVVLGDTFLVIGFSLWLISGIVFPTWTDLVIAQPISSEFYLHFIASQFITGMIVSVVAFFVITFVFVRAILPRLLAVTPPDEGVSQRLVGLSKRAVIYQNSLVLAAFLAVLMLGMSGKDIRLAFIGIALVGAVSYVAAFLLGRLIQRDLAALAKVVDPREQLSSVGVESSRISSRRGNGGS